MSNEVWISPAVLGKIARRAHAHPDEEICGAILRGEDIPVDNISKQRDRRFRMDPQQQMAIWESWARKGELIIYHSHPKGLAEPSDEDKWVISRSPEITFVIFSPRSGWFKAYRYSEDARGIIELKIHNSEVSTQPDQPSTVTSGPTN